MTFIDPRLTERRNPRTAEIDLASPLEIVDLINAEDRTVPDAVATQREAIARAIERAERTFRDGGRLFYVGAGTSGRLGVLDAAECPPTFCSEPGMVVGVIAGGEPALRHSIEAVEDDTAAGKSAMEDLAVNKADVVLGIAAGGTTPFVHGALIEAADRGARTAFLICTDPSHVQLPPGIPEVWIAVQTGPEVVTGSTRLKAGSATKLILNRITTLAMVQIGKTYGNLMVDIDATKNAKLKDRGARIISQLTNLDRPAALALLEKSGGKVKRAIVMHAKACDVFTADRLLKDAGGKLRAVIG